MDFQAPASVLYSDQAALGPLRLAVSSLIMSLPSTPVQNIQKGRTVSISYLYSGSPAPHECCLMRKGNRFWLLPIPFLCLLFPLHFAFQMSKKKSFLLRPNHTILPQSLSLERHCPPKGFQVTYMVCLYYTAVCFRSSTSLSRKQ